jgi:hypothetical protein
MQVDPNRNDSLGVMLEVPCLDNHGSFIGQIDAVIDGLDAIERLRIWYLNNTGIVSTWLATVSK